jgi:hypothetical protein
MRLPFLKAAEHTQCFPGGQEAEWRKIAALCGRSADEIRVFGLAGKS